MWVRSELKEKGKINFKKFYWKSVVVSLICALLSGGMNSQVTKKIGESYNPPTNGSYYYEYHIDDESFNQDEILNEIGNSVEKFINSGIVLTVALIGVLFASIGFIIKLLIIYPIQIGKNNYFVGIREEEKTLESLIFNYKSGKLKNTIFTMFMKGLFQILWALLLIIPGIIKSYEYRMIPYILSENPEISRQRAFELSKHMMKGNKWRTFVLDLSFIGWYLLSALTIGILAVFYVNPYVESTNAELYAYLKDEVLKNGYASIVDFKGK